MLISECYCYFFLFFNFHFVPRPNQSFGHHHQAGRQPPDAQALYLFLLGAKIPLFLTTLSFRKVSKVLIFLPLFFFAKKDKNRRWFLDPVPNDLTFFHMEGLAKSGILFIQFFSSSFKNVNFKE